MTAATRRTWTAWRRPWTDAIPAVVAALAVSSVLALDEEGGSGSYETHYADQGSNTTLHCLGQSGPSGVLWTHHRYFLAIHTSEVQMLLYFFFHTDILQFKILRRRGPEDEGAILPHRRTPLPSASRRILPQPNGDLLLLGLLPEDSKPYTCQDMESNESIHTVFLVVRTVPPAVANLTVIPHSVFALVTWSPVADDADGGYPVDGYVLGYRRDSGESEAGRLDPRIHSSAETLREAADQWSYVRNIAPSATSKAVYGLVPNSTYYFRLCAVNRLGMGEDASVAVRTLFDESEVEAAHDLVLEDRGQREGGGEQESAFKLAMVGVTVFVVTFGVIGFGISLLLIRNCDNGRRSGHSSSGCDATEEEAMELVPHITLNPSFNIDMLEFEQGEDRADAIANHIEGAARDRDPVDGDKDGIALVVKSTPRGIGAAANARAAAASEVSPSRPNG